MIDKPRGNASVSKMTVYSGVLSSHKLITVGAEGKVRKEISLAAEPPFSITPFRLNLVLTFLMLAIVLSYIFASNFLVSQRYILGVRRQQFNQIGAALQAENPELGSSDGLNNLLIFAQASGMVEAKDASFVVEEGGIALSGAQAPVENLR